MNAMLDFLAPVATVDRPLWPHQASAIEKLRGAVSMGVLSIMLEAPTGAGKTRIGAEIISNARAKGKRVLFVVPALSLVDQTVDRLREQGLREIGVMQGLHMLTDWNQPVQIASEQTLARRNLPEFDVLVIDEAHKFFEFYKKLIADAVAAGKVVIGLSATPWTKGLGRHYAKLIKVASTAELIEAGHLSPFKVFAPSHPDLTKVRTVAGDYHEGDLSDAMNTDVLVADVVTTWLERGERRPTFCFAVDRAHAKSLQRQFLAAGIGAGYIDSHTTKDEREAIKRQFHTGEIAVVCSVGCLTTGVDWDVRCVILARPTKSEMLFVQIIGRGLRAAKGKKDCLILDHSDTHLRLGFVTDIGHDVLDMGKKSLQLSRAKSDKPRECPKCHYLRPAKINECPSCGFVPERQNGVEHADGELIEFKAPSRKNADSERKASVFGQLKQIAKDNGYSQGWAAHKYKDFFGEWPNAYAWVPLEPPMPDVVRWVKHKQIAFAKAKRKAEAHGA